MRRLTILAALFFVALFIVSFVVVEVDASPANQTILKADIQMDGAVMIESAAPRSAYNFDPDPQLVGAISPFDTKISGHQFVANIDIDHPMIPAANAQSYVSPSPALSQIMLIKKGGIIPFGVASI